MNPFLRLLLSAALLAACAAPTSEDADSVDSELGSPACAGAACGALATPQALVRGGIAAANHELYWITGGTTTDGNGYMIDSLSHCALPACATVTSVPLVQDGFAIWASGLQTAGDKVVFYGEGSNARSSSIYLSDGAAVAQIVPTFSGQHDKLAVDAKGIAVYTEDRRTDGWARSTVSVCDFEGLGLSKTCVTWSDASLNGIWDVVLTPTRVAIEHSMGLYTYDRATLKDPQHALITTDEGGAELHNVGESFVGFRTEVVSRPGTPNDVNHDTRFWGENVGTTPQGHLDGTLQATVSDGTRLFVGTVGEGDVWERPSEGVLAKVYPKSGRVYVRATQQDVRAIAFDGAQLYWLDKPADPKGSIGDAVGVVRTVAR